MPPRTLLFTLAEDEASSTETHFAALHRVDEHDGLSFAAALRDRGHEVWFVNWRDVVPDRRVLRRAFRSNHERFERNVALDRFDLVFVYKMEGFLADPARFFTMVEAFEQCCATVVNAPATIRSNIDKSYLFELRAAGIPVIPSWRLRPAAATSRHEPRVVPDHETHRPEAAVASLLAQGASAVVKPLRGERGTGIVRLDASAGEPRWQEVLRTLDPSAYFLQRFEPGIRDGERSLAYLGHVFQHAVLKRPNPADPAEFRCNESLGGTVHPYTPTGEELHIASRVLHTAESLGWPVRFSRIDLVPSDCGPVLMEAELLNPSVYANYLGRGDAFGRALADYFETLMA